MEDSLSKISGAFEIRQGLPRPKWDVITSWIDANVASDLLDESWTQVALDWLARLSQSLPRDYRLYESPDFFVLAADESFGRRVLRSSERARRIILRTLDGVACDEGYGRHVVLLFADTASYYDYVTDFYPEEGEFGLSSGMFVDVGYGHFALGPECGDDYEVVVAHELNHALLRHLPLPLWLNEGVTQVMEDVVMESSYFMVDREILSRHRAYWNSETIQAFWSGDSFFSPDDGQELSYHLSQVLFRNLMSDYPQVIFDVLNNANFCDAGNAAVLNACNVSLADRAAQFLGDGEWTPSNDYAVPDA